MSIESLQPRKTLVEEVHRRILDAICDGTLAPGERVTQDELAARLQVSRQPVMTALGLLKQQGFLVEHGRRGLQVAPVDRARFDAIYQLRSALEPLAASLAAARATRVQVAQGRGLVAHGQRVAATEDPGAALQADVDFHSWIYDTSGNPLIAQSMQTHWQHLRRSMSEVLRRPRYVQRVWAEHARILEAIAAGDAEGAAQSMSSHVRTAHERVGAELTAAARSAA